MSSPDKFRQLARGEAADVRALEERRRLPREKLGRHCQRLREVYVSNQPLRRMSRPGTREPLPPRALAPELDYRGDARPAFPMAHSAGQSFFGRRSFVNRVWAAYFGVGLVEPVDNFSVANPPSNAPLLTPWPTTSPSMATTSAVWSAHPAVANLPALRHPQCTNASDRTNYARGYVAGCREVVVEC